MAEGIERTSSEDTVAAREFPPPPPFDTLKTVRDLQESGMDRETAEGVVGAMRETMTSTLTTKQDLAIATTEIKAEVTVLDGKVENLKDSVDQLATKDGVEAAIAKAMLTMTWRVLGGTALLLGAFYTLDRLFG